MTNILAVIFDLDGTLINSAPDIAAAVNRYLVENDWPAQDIDFIEQFIGHGPRRLLVDVFSQIGHPTDDAAVRAAHLAYLSNYNDAPAERTKFYPNVKEDLAALRKVGLRLGVCTNKPHELTQKVLGALGIGDLFEVAIGADAVPACKPDPGHLLEVLRRMSLEPADILYVGDTVVDQNTARAAGADFCCVPWGGGGTLQVAASQRLTRLSDILDRFNICEQVV